jgi:hypothetical protein
MLSTRREFSLKHFRRISLHFDREKRLQHISAGGAEGGPVIAEISGNIGGWVVNHPDGTIPSAVRHSFVV